MNSVLVSNLRHSLNFTDPKGLAIPAVILAIMSMLVVPLPSIALDVLFTFNIMAGLIIIMICINVHRPLEFSSFPSSPPTSNHAPIEPKRRFDESSAATRPRGP